MPRRAALSKDPPVGGGPDATPSSRATGGQRDDGRSERRALRLRLLAGAGLLAASLAALTLLGLLLTGWQTREWREVLRGGALSRGAEADALFVSMRRLREWRSARGEVPRTVKELDGEAVTIIGIARPEAGKRAAGLWLVADPLALASHRPPPLDGAVWVELPEGTKALDVVQPAVLVRATGILRVGITELPGGGSAAYRLDLGTLSVREAPPDEHVHGEGCEHDH